MSFHIKYYRLFEVRLLHEYYLLGEGSSSFFDLSQPERETVLQNRLLKGQYILMNDLMILPTYETKQLLDKRRLKLIQTFTGFTVASQGVAATLTNGTDAIKPAIGLEESLNLTFMIKVKNPFFKNYTSLPLRREQDGGYFFTNSPDNVTGSDYLALSKPVETFVLGKNYAPGDIASFSGVLKEASANTNSMADWDSIESDGYVNESDRILLNNVFRYKPQVGEVGGDIVFALKKMDGTTVKTIEVPALSVNGQLLDFSDTRISVLSPPTPIKYGEYNLEITSSTGIRTRSVYLHPEAQAADVGMVHIRFSEAVASYAILGAEGQIRVPYPVFELRFRSRRTYWRYTARQTSKRLVPLNNDVANHFLNEANSNAVPNIPTKFLVTKSPQKLTHLPMGVSGGGGPAQALPKPQPSPLSLKKQHELFPGEPPGRIYSEVALASVASLIKAVN